MNNLKNVFKKIEHDLQSVQQDQLVLFNESELSTILKKYQPDLNDFEFARLQKEFSSYGPLDVLFKDLTIQEIICNDWQNIWFEKNGQWHQHQDSFLSKRSYRNFLASLCKDLHAELGFEKPFLNGFWQGHRVHISSSQAGHEINNQISFRKRHEAKLTVDTLLTQDWCTLEQKITLLDLVEKRKTLLIVGATTSGKTTVLNAILHSLQRVERWVVLEDTDELQIPNLLSTKLLTRSETAAGIGEINLQDLVRQSLRMRPDRLVIGEIRGSEAKDLLLALSTGHAGSLATLHAQNSQEALLRLEMLVQMGAPQWSVQTVRRLMQLSIHAVVVVEKIDGGQRKLKEICKISSLEDFGFLIEKIA